MASTPSELSDNPLGPEAVPRCTIHGKRLSFFCGHHEVLLCSVCAVKRHKGCENVLTIAEAREDKYAIGKAIIETYEQKISLFENAVLGRQAAKKMLESNTQDVQNEISEVAEKLIGMVRREERVLLDNVMATRNRELTAINTDIVNLDGACEHVRRKHATLSECLNLREVDLITGVVQEQRPSDDVADIEYITNKRYREVDVKFIVSPHVESFLRHFKAVGQLMLSDESVKSVRIARSNSAAALTASDQGERDTGHRKSYGAHSVPSSPTDHMGGAGGERHISAREKWQRDRLRQMNAQHSRANDVVDGDVRYDRPAASSLTAERRERRQLPMRALPSPDMIPSGGEYTPRERPQPPRRTSASTTLPRPSSTPPTTERNPTYNTSTISTSPKLKDVGRFTTPVRYLTRQSSQGADPERSPTDGDGWKSPTEMTSPRQGVFHIEPVHVFQERMVIPDSQPPSRQRPSTPSSRLNKSLSSIPVSGGILKDCEFGRSFAAVQISTKTRDTTKHDVPVSSPSSDGFHAPRKSVIREITELRINRNSTPATPVVDESSAREFLRQELSQPIEENRSQRWVYLMSYPKSDAGNKRLISGIVVLDDERIVLVDQEHYALQLFGRDFKFQSELKLQSRPFDVLALSNNKVAVSLQTDRMLKFVLIDGRGLTSVADLSVPCDMVCYGICRGGGNYCVCCGDEVWILSEEGRVVNRLQKSKNGEALFMQAEYVTMNTSGNVVYVSDAGNNKVLAMHMDGRRLWEFTYQGFKPSGIVYFMGHVYVCDRDQHRVLMLNTDGQVVKQSVVGKLENPRAVCFNGAGDRLMLTQMRYDAVICPEKPVHVYTKENLI